MMLHFAIIFIPAIVITLLAKLIWHKDICGKEGLISLGINIAASAFLYGMLALYVSSKTSDQYVLTGQVSSKYSEKVSCEHSYECNCVKSCSGSGSSQTCTEVCQTCYDHPYDVNWVVKSTVGSVNIDRVNRQGTKEPPRFTQVKIGEPFSAEFSFRNYLLADPNSLFLYSKTVGENHPTPGYPRVYDYYRINRVQGNKELNEYLNDYLIGKRFNAIPVFTTKDESYFYSLMANWKGGKKNDILMVYGMDGDNIKWFQSVSYGKGLDNRLLHDTLRIETQGKQFSLELFKTQLDKINKEFRQVDTAQFEHLKYAIQIPLWLILILVAVNAATSIGIAFYMKNNTLGSRRNRFTSRRR
jgi:hypothetical protein